MKHFFDIGANTGQTFDLFLAADNLCHNEFDGGTVWCFEPSPRHLGHLLARAEAYRDRFKINICPFGLGDCDTVQTFWQKDDPRGDSFSERLNQTSNIGVGYKILVPVFSIARFMSRHTSDGDEVTLKIDAEGAEYRILNDLALDHHSAMLGRVTRIYVEWHSCDDEKTYPNGEIFKQQYKELGHPIEGWMF